MELENPNNSEFLKFSADQTSKQPDLRNPNNGETPTSPSIPLFHDEIDSSFSTPYVSAPSSPTRRPNGFFFSAPASPMHFSLSSSSASSDFISSDFSTEFEFCARFGQSSSSTVGSMSSADELFLNGQIRPMKLSSHLQRPQNLAPLMDLDLEDEDGEEIQCEGRKEGKTEEFASRGRDQRIRSRSLHRRTRSLSPLRIWQSANDDEGAGEKTAISASLCSSDPKISETPSDATTPSVSASSSRSSSSSSRSSKRWIFLMDLLLRSKSEGRGENEENNSKEKFWSSISFSQKDKKAQSLSSSHFRNRRLPEKRASSARKPAAVAGTDVKRREPPSPHEVHYTAKRAQAEEMKKKTFLPYRQGLFGCLGFSSRSYGAMTGFARTLNPV